MFHTTLPANAGDIRFAFARVACRYPVEPREAGIHMYVEVADLLADGKVDLHAGTVAVVDGSSRRQESR